MKALMMVGLLFFLSANVWAALPQCDQTLLEVAKQTSQPMPKTGIFARDTIENVKGRTLVLLTAEEKRGFGIDPSDLAFANFRHAGHFFVAHIPGLKVDATNTPLPSSGSGLQDVHVISEHWEALTKPALADFEVHTYLSFNFSAGQGVRLDYNQTLNVSVDPSAPPVSNAVLSIEALRPSSNPNASLVPYAFVFDLAIGHLFYDKADRDQAEESDTGKIDEHLPLSLDGKISRIAGLDNPKDALLFSAIQSSQVNGRRQTYNFVINNCTNRLFDLLDGAIQSRTPFNQSEFVANVKKAVAADIPRAIDTLKSTIAAYGKTLPPSALTDLNRLSPDQLDNALINGAIKSQTPSEYQTWFPPFVKAHLIGRGLIPN